LSKAGVTTIGKEEHMSNRTYAAYKHAKPYFDLVRGALGDLVEGTHFFDVVDEETVYEVLYDVPGWPHVVRGRAALMEQFRGYVQHIEIRTADHLVTHRADGTGVVILEYVVQGTILASGVAYTNRFCSVIRLKARKIAHWRDYMDSLAAWNALTAGAR
jgi:uncharacterized protein